MALGEELATQQALVSNPQALQGFNVGYLPPDMSSLNRPVTDTAPSRGRLQRTTQQEAPQDPYDLPKPPAGKLFLLGLLGGPNLVQFGLQQHFQKVALPKMRDLEIRGNQALREDDTDTADEVLQGMNKLAAQVPQLGRVADQFTTQLNEKRNKIEANKTLIGIMKDKYANDPVAQRAVGFVSARLGTLDPKQTVDLFASFKPEIKNDNRVLEVISPSGELLKRQAKTPLQAPEDFSKEVREAFQVAQAQKLIDMNEVEFADIQNKKNTNDPDLKYVDVKRAEHAQQVIAKVVEQGVMVGRVPVGPQIAGGMSPDQARQLAFGAGTPQMPSGSARARVQVQPGTVSQPGGQNAPGLTMDPTVRGADVQRAFPQLQLSEAQADQLAQDPQMQRHVRAWMQGQQASSGNVAADVRQQQIRSQAQETYQTGLAGQTAITEARPMSDSSMYIRINSKGKMEGAPRGQSEASVSRQGYASVPFPVGTKLVQAYNFLQSDAESLKKELSRMSGTESERFWSAFTNFLSKGAGMPVEGVTPFGKITLNFTGLTNAGLSKDQIRLAQKLVMFAQSTEAVMNPGDHPNVDVGQVKSILTSLIRERGQIREVMDVTKETVEGRVRQYFQALHSGSTATPQTPGEESREASIQNRDNPSNAPNTPAGMDLPDRITNFIRNLPTLAVQDIKREISEYSRIAGEVKGALKPYIKKAIEMGKEIVEMQKEPVKIKRTGPINPKVQQELGGFQ